MKKVVMVLSLVLMCLISERVLANPWLICDPANDPAVASYSVTTDGVTVTDIVPQTGWIVTATGKLSLVDPGDVAKTPVTLLMDLVGISPGPHIQTAVACTAPSKWGPGVCSVSSNPLSYTRPVPGVVPAQPANTLIAAQ